jgi:hypothetical protein
MMRMISNCVGPQECALYSAAGPHGDPRHSGIAVPLPHELRVAVDLLPQLCDDEVEDSVETREAP